MSYPTLYQMESLGIKIQLTKKGKHNLAKILEQGCPVKYIDGENVLIKCPLGDDITKTCYKCWYDWLNRHAEIIKEDKQNGTATC